MLARLWEFFYKNILPYRWKKKGKKRKLSSTDQWKLVSWTDGSSEEENLHVDVNFVEPIDLATN